MEGARRVGDQHGDADRQDAPAEIRDDIKRRSQGMSGRLFAEIYEENHPVLPGRQTVAPSSVADSAEGNAIFQGLNHGRRLLEPVVKAATRAARKPDEVADAYDRKIEARNNEAAQ